MSFGVNLTDMALYIISYDLLNKKTFGEYEDLINELRRLGAQKALYSQWIWRSTDSSVTIRDHLRKFMHTDDRIPVTEITANWASYNLLVDMNKV